MDCASNVFILRNTVTSPETYLIVLTSSVKTLGVKAIPFHRIGFITFETADLTETFFLIFGMINNGIHKFIVLNFQHRDRLYASVIT